jgi:hypothetical protein
MTLERCKEQVAICEKRFIDKVWALMVVIGVIGGGFGLIWGASSWQTKTEMRIGGVEAVGFENKAEIRTLRSDIDKMQAMNSKLDTIVRLLKR